MIGIVAVSHSPKLAEAAKELALQMTGQNPPNIQLAAGTASGEFGTDAMAVAESIGAADSGEGVVIISDLGSAVLSAEMACEFVFDVEVRVVAAPFVEGLLAAAVAASGGKSLDEVVSAARSALNGKIEQLADEPAEQKPAEKAEEADARASVKLINPMGLHARPAAALARLVNDLGSCIKISTATGRSADTDSPLSIAGLGTVGGDEISIEGFGEDAAADVERVRELLASGFGEVAEPASESETNAPQTAGISAGRVVGPVATMAVTNKPPAQGEKVPEAQRQGELQRALDSLEQTAEQLNQQAKTADPTAKDILQATAQLVCDGAVRSRVSQLINDSGATAEQAVWDAFSEVVIRFDSAGGKLAERACDVRDIRARVVARLEGRELAGIPTSDKPFILVARDLAPADAAQIDPKTCLGLVLGECGPTSHTAILARALGIPAVMNSGYAELHDGQRVLIDGSTGDLVVEPTDEQAEGARTAPEMSASIDFSGPGATADGVPITLAANIGWPQDVPVALANNAEGSGLFRTEFCFLNRSDAPSVSEQEAQYAQVLRGFEGKKVVIRTLDAGSDKPLPFVTIPGEENPALGVRGYRTSWRSPQILEDQLRAIANAAAQTGNSPWVMAPMIATVEEADEFAKLARSYGLKTVGVMVETPAAALCADELFEVVDFVSIGTNDLTQYTMAADRHSGELAHLGTPWQPAVLKLIAMIGKAGSRTGKSVGVCGEAASDPLLAGVLVGLGVTSLSMAPQAIGRVGTALAKYSLESCRKAAQLALATSAPDAAKAAAEIALQA